METNRNNIGTSLLLLFFLQSVDAHSQCFFSFTVPNYMLCYGMLIYTHVPLHDLTRAGFKCTNDTHSTLAYDHGAASTSALTAFCACAMFSPSLREQRALAKAPSTTHTFLSSVLIQVCGMHVVAVGIHVSIGATMGGIHGTRTTYRHWG